jgi:hypothetical protein
MNLIRRLFGLCKHNFNVELAKKEVLNFNHT